MKLPPLPPLLKTAVPTIINIIDMKNSKVEERDLNPEVFNGEIKDYLVHEVVRAHLANRRQGTASTKTRSEVRGGGKKPWRQKGTGRARAGTIRSPLWRGGGIVFGPKPRDYSYSVPKKVRRAALRSVLTAKFQESRLLVVDRFSLETPKTKEMYAILKGLIGGQEPSALLALGDWSEAVWRSARNIPDVKVIRVEQLNVYTALLYDYLILDKSAVNYLEGMLAS